MFSFFLRVCPDLLPQIYPDPELEQQILALAIRCIHSEEGCRWTGQMKQLQVKSFNTLSLLPHQSLHLLLPPSFNCFPLACVLQICRWI